MATRGPATLAAQPLPLLTDISIASGSQSAAAVRRIESDADVERWKKSEAHEQVVLFVARLCEAAVGRPTEMQRKEEELASDMSSSEDGVKRVWRMLDEIQRWTQEIEPLKTPQRFGNLAFRAWGVRMEERVRQLHETLLPASMHPFIDELATYLLGSFGSWVRLDYGSGHELSFAAWLCFLARLGFFGCSQAGMAIQPAALKPSLSYESRLALTIMPKYLEVAWGVQDRYGLEPAGSHGVWGLDDYHFIPYAIGAAQLRSQAAYPPLAVTSASHKPERLPASPLDLLLFVPSSSPLPQIGGRVGSMLRADSAAPSTSPLPGPPFANLYTSSIARIHALKRGPFHEHSPILHDVATTVPHWVKVQQGMMKMWTAECLGKRPVVQHFPFGGVAFRWPGGFT